MMIRCRDCGARFDEPNFPPHCLVCNSIRLEEYGFERPLDEKPHNEGWD